MGRGVNYVWHNQVLIRLIKSNNVRRMAEVGVWKGRSMRAILRSECKDILEDYWVIDQWELMGKEHGRMGRITQKDWDDIYFSVCKYMSYFPQLRIVRMKSLEAASLCPKEYFDLVYLDASHFYDDVVADIKAWLPLVRKGGILAGHDYGTGRRKGHRVKPAVDSIFGEGKAIQLEDGVWVVHI